MHVVGATTRHEGMMGMEIDNRTKGTRKTRGGKEKQALSVLKEEVLSENVGGEGAVRKKREGSLFGFCLRQKKERSLESFFF